MRRPGCTWRASSPRSAPPASSSACSARSSPGTSSSAVFDLANSPHGISKPELGYLFGPALILIALPLVRHRQPRVAYTSRYRTRLAIALGLWTLGLLFLLTHLAGLDGEYTLRAGAYVASGLMSVGLLATVAMWPAGLRTGLFDRRGGVETPADAG